MKQPQRDIRTVDDLEIAAKALAFHFRTGAVVVVGSQSILVGWPDAPELMKNSGEIDAFPANARQWEEKLRLQAESEEDFIEASEETNAWFGEGSDFAIKHGFYIDGVDERTARLPTGWQERAVYREVEGQGRTITVVAPCTDDMIVSKLQRLVEKDRGYIESYHKARPLNIEMLLTRLESMNPPSEVMNAARVYLRSLTPSGSSYRAPDFGLALPPCPQGTHCRFLGSDGMSVTVRVWDEDTRIFYRVDNPLGPAVVTPEAEKYFIQGKALTYEKWDVHPDVQAAREGRLSGPLPPWS